MEFQTQNGKSLAKDFFRREYTKMLGVVSKYLSYSNVQEAEDIVQETLLKASEYWEANGIPANPEAWLYKTARNLNINLHRCNKVEDNYLETIGRVAEDLDFSEEAISDEQLRMIFHCCSPILKERSQIALILKILCGFSVSEIADAFFDKKETVHKRLVRARKTLRQEDNWLKVTMDIEKRLPVVLKSIYLLYNEGYSPRQSTEILRMDLCLEAIRLGELIADHPKVEEKGEVFSLLSLMYINAARFRSRFNEQGQIVEMRDQDRSLWDQGMIHKGLHYIYRASELKQSSTYLLLAMISANHSTAPTYKDTNWKEILALYDGILKIEDSVLTRMNRSIPLAEVTGNKVAIQYLNKLGDQSDITDYYLYYSTLAEFYKRENQHEKAAAYLESAISMCKNPRDKSFLEKKLDQIVPK